MTDRFESEDSPFAHETMDESSATLIANDPHSEEEIDNADSLMSTNELREFYSTLDQFTPAIPETVTRYYMRQCALQTDDDRLVKLLSVSVQKFLSEIVNDCFQLHKLREKSSNRAAAAAAAQPPPAATTEATTSTNDPSAAVASSKKSASTTNTLTLNDLTHVLGEYDINVKKTFYYT